jgi:ADP-heptose:LPS heptosyltransferase
MGQKILVIRFSSIGDIVLTTPVVRALKQQIPEVEIHYLTKKTNYSLLQNNKYIDKIHLLEDADLFYKLRKEKFDYIVDLHKNLRSFKIKLALGVKSKSFQKLNLKKLLLVTKSSPFSTKSCRTYEISHSKLCEIS